jgi:hypothetical protein
MKESEERRKCREIKEEETRKIIYNAKQQQIIGKCDNQVRKREENSHG